MSSVVGVELSTDRVRAVALTRRPAAWQGDWDPARPDELVARLRQQFGPISRVALSVGLGFLHVKHVSLPPSPHAERRRMLALEPDRFFPVQGEPVVVALAAEGDLAFAIEADLLDRWVLAFETWAPVDLVEASPLSLARALPAGAQGTYALPAGPGEQGLADVQDGAVRLARRIPADEPVPGTKPLPSRGGVEGEHLIAFGAARGLDQPLEATLLSDGHRARIVWRRRTKTLRAAVACLAALILALWSLDASRERKLERIRAEIGRIEPGLTFAIELNEQLAALDRELVSVAAITARRMDPLRVLAALSERLPVDVTVLGLRAEGDGWRIDGRARDAAAILPALDGDTRFEDVRFLSASTRFREGDRTWETFSIAFRVRAPA